MASILVKKGTEAALLATNPVVASGELIYSTDTSKLKVGDGITYYSGLPVVGSGTYAALTGATFTGLVTSTSGNFTNSLQLNGTGVSINGHTHTSSNITDFNTSVSGLLPTIINSGDNRVLTSTGSTVGVNAESNLTFNGSLLTAPSGSFTTSLQVASTTLTSGDMINLVNSMNLYLWANFR